LRVIVLPTGPSSTGYSKGDNKKATDLQLDER
jgi:hypothetical protein